MFVIKMVDDLNFNKYFTGVDYMTPQFSDNIQNAQKLSPEDCAGNIMALIECCMIGLPEYTGDEEHKDSNYNILSTTLSKGMFVQDLSLLIKQTLMAVNVKQPHDTTESRKNHYLSVWEWMTAVVETN